MGEQYHPDQLIDATLDLCIRCGYENTTVEQIAAVAGITPDEFKRHFSTKDAALMAVIETLLHAAATALPKVDVDASPEQALLLAHTEMLIAITRGRGVVTRHRMIGIAQIFGSQPSLRKQASSARKRVLTPALAERMGVDPADRRVHQAVTNWSAVAASAYLDRYSLTAGYDPRHDDQLAALIMAELRSTFTDIMGGAS